MTGQTLSPELRAQLVSLAIEAGKRAYIPYSHYPVGAALLTGDGTIVQGCNVENASFGATICAERTAVVKAISEGQREFKAIAIVTRNGGSPCGICRQVLYEFAPELWVILADDTGQIHAEMPLNDLLLRGFGPGSL